MRLPTLLVSFLIGMLATSCNVNGCGRNVDPDILCPMIDERSASIHFNLREAPRELSGGTVRIERPVYIGQPDSGDEAGVWIEQFTGSPDRTYFNLPESLGDRAGFGFRPPTPNENAPPRVAFAIHQRNSEMVVKSDTVWVEALKVPGHSELYACCDEVPMMDIQRLESTFPEADLDLRNRWTTNGLHEPGQTVDINLRH